MKIAFICTHNRCRSILCEAITNSLAQGGITAMSGGSEPAGEVHPLTIKFLQERGISIEGLRSKSWDELESLQPDVVITVCDSAAGEACPVWFGTAVRVHWGLPDPSRLAGASEDQARAAFGEVIATIERRVAAFVAGNFRLLQGEQLKVALQQIAKED